MEQYLLQVEGLKTYFFTQRGIMKAVDGVSFRLSQGETLGLVGESGCGKSVTALSILRLVPRPAGKIVEGKVIFEGEDLLRKSEKEMRMVRGRKISMILQDPMSALNPVFSIGDQLVEAIAAHQKDNRQTRWDRSKEILRRVRIPSPEVRMGQYPHQLSGGTRQRVVGAIAVSCEPKLLIADEPTTSLDLTIQAQYLALLNEIQTQTKAAMLFITHDFGIVANMCQRVAVMYAGKIVEMASVRELFDHPLHPYSVALMKSVPKMEDEAKRPYCIKGSPPSLDNLPRGCSFAPRCESARDRCGELAPSLRQLDMDHSVSCLLYD